MGWSAAAAGSLLFNPLPWQRYALPWIPAAILLAAVGVSQIVRYAAQRWAESRGGVGMAARRGSHLR
ncbi:MAG: hypothetical protein CUN53_14650 [Phototrophicales bacterium]|nr:MAG: hypothetical protein CUN53_14650 [Phototrophicales bacterium]